MYTGWFPDAEQPGLGIARIDNNDLFQNEGLFPPSETFPTYGHDLKDPGQNFTSHSITDLRKRNVMI